jgi:A/G-specific adenine glycosylase
MGADHPLKPHGSPRRATILANPAAGCYGASRRRIATFQRRLLAWYRVWQRDLPWRRTRNPYRILVSEIMLQQTQVDRVIPKYREFLRRYPTARKLAKAPAGELRKVWYPLGYNVRPLRLRRIAQEVVRRHQGRVPDTYEGLLAMDGIGRYTAGAVLSFAFNRDAPILDTNVARLLGRYFGVGQPPRAPMPRVPRPGVWRPVAQTPSDPTRRDGAAGRPPASVQRRLWELAAAVIPQGRGYDMNQAMMDFGALVCLARAPKCPTCVLRRGCASVSAQPNRPPRLTGRRKVITASEGWRKPQVVPSS